MSSRSEPDSRSLTPRAFALLLARLGDDPERGGEQYEALRRALVRFFDWRGAATPDLCADETLDRLARKLDEDAAIDDVRGFAHGIARLVLLEHWRRPRELPIHETPFGDGPAAQAAPDEEDPRTACFEGCLAELPAEGRALILAYYAAEGREKIDGRKRMAASLGLSDTALRNRAQRLRDRLERCIGRCLAPGADTKP
jgi:DNA-directed RNA polymerase specialized sigma24 family protein